MSGYTERLARRRSAVRFAVEIVLAAAPGPLTFCEIRLAAGEPSEHLVRVALRALLAEGLVTSERRGRDPLKSWGYSADPGGCHPATVYRYAHARSARGGGGSTADEEDDHR